MIRHRKSYYNYYITHNQLTEKKDEKFINEKNQFLERF